MGRHAGCALTFRSKADALQARLNSDYKGFLFLQAVFDFSVSSSMTLCVAVEAEADCGTTNGH
jgi:hypothetical protein